MSDLDKMRARLREASAEPTPEVSVPIDEESVNCIGCGGSGKIGFTGIEPGRVDCPECGGSGVRLEGERAPRRPKMSKKLADAWMGTMDFGKKSLRVTLLSDEPSPLAMTMDEVDDETKLTGPGLITDKIAPGTETSVRFSKRMFIRPGGMICFGVIHDEPGTILSVFKLGSIIHDGDEFRASFKMDEGPPRAERPPKLTTPKGKRPILIATRMSPEDLMPPTTGPEWPVFDVGVLKEKAKSVAPPPARYCVDCRKRLFFRFAKDSDPTRCRACKTKREAMGTRIDSDPK